VKNCLQERLMCVKSKIGHFALKTHRRACEQTTYLPSLNAVSCQHAYTHVWGLRQDRIRLSETESVSYKGDTDGVEVVHCHSLLAPPLEKRQHPRCRMAVPRRKLRGDRCSHHRSDECERRICNVDMLSTRISCMKVQAHRSWNCGLTCESIGMMLSHMR
jgi:hypothetical protein